MKQQLIQTRVKSSGFTLPELMIAAALGVGLALVAGEAMRAHLQSNAKAESIQRQREDWNRTTSFLESEIAMSGRILTNPAGVSIPPQCDLTASELKLALDLSRDLPLVLYGIRAVENLPAAERTQWLGEGLNNQNYGVLIRCGPKLNITADGSDDYDSSSAAQQTILLDGIDTSAPGGGLYVKVHDAKSASFTLSVKGLTSSRFSNTPRRSNTGWDQGPTRELIQLQAFRKKPPRALASAASMLKGTVSARTLVAITSSASLKASPNHLLFPIRR